jgi:hypothetical protein
VTGVFFFFFFSFGPFAYSIGSDLIRKQVINSSTGNPYNMEDIAIIGTATISAMMSLGSVIPLLPAIVRARISARKIIDVIERKPLIDTNPGS